jgi:hypothetical protein
MFLQQVVGALEAHGVKYALVGGYAVALHGAVRGTVDIDIVIGLSKVAYQRAEAALEDLGLTSRLPLTAQDVYTFREEYINNRNLSAWSFINPDNPLEVVDILITEDVNKLRVVTKKAFGMNIRVVAIPDLIAIKKQSSRPQDLEDIRALEKLK